MNSLDIFAVYTEFDQVLYLICFPTAFKGRNIVILFAFLANSGAPQKEGKHPYYRIKDSFHAFPREIAICGAEFIVHRDYNLIKPYIYLFTLNNVSF
jgi:hypothetical protein